MKEPTKEFTELTIEQRLFEVSKKISNIQKDSYNEYHKYSYLSANGALEIIKPIMLEHGLIVLPTCLECSEAQGLTTVKMLYKVASVTTSECLEFIVFGQGQDKSDKGIYKAYTGALKYFLFQLFMISTGDDPEADSLPRVPRRIPAPEPKPEKEKPAPVKRTAKAAAPEPQAAEFAGENPWGWEIEHAENKHAGKMLFMIEAKHLKDMHDYAYPDFLTADDLGAIAAALKQPKRRQPTFEAWQDSQKEDRRIAAGAPTAEADDQPY